MTFRERMVQLCRALSEGMNVGMKYQGLLLLLLSACRGAGAWHL